MLFKKYFFLVFWSLTKTAVQDKVSELSTDLEKAKIGLKSRLIVTVFGNDLDKKFSIRKHPETTDSKNENRCNPPNHYILSISDCVLVSQKFYISHDSDIPIAIDYFVDCSENPSYIYQPHINTSSLETITNQTHNTDIESSIGVKTNKTKKPINISHDYAFKYIIKMCNGNENIQNPLNFFEKIEDIFECFKKQNFDEQNFDLESLFKTNCFVFVCLNVIEKKMKDDLKCEAFFKCISESLIKRMRCIEIARHNCPILSLFPGLIFLKDFIFDQISKKPIKEISISSIFYGLKTIEIILQSPSLSFPVVNSKVLYNYNSKYTEYKLSPEILKKVRYDLRKVLYTIRLIKSLLLSPNEGKIMCKLIINICFYMHNDFINGKYTKNIILKCVRDLVFLFDVETKKYLESYFYRNNESDVVRPLITSYEYDFEHFSIHESLKFIEYYLKLFQSETFKKYINLSSSDYTCYIDYFIKIKERIKTTNDPCCEDTATLLEGICVYKYLEIIEDSREIPKSKSFEEVQTKLLVRVERLFRTRFNARNLFQAINKSAISLLNYHIGVLRLEPPGFSKLDDAVRAVLVKNKIHLRPGRKERLYLPRKALGRGSPSVEFKSEHMLLQLLDSLKKHKDTSTRRAAILKLENNNKTHLSQIKNFLKIKYGLEE
ncbi:hypothetical protein CWI39_0028p0010, partial [Hamiltosporidium magnivora]